MPKRYYWLKLQEDFFNSKRIKKLRRIAGGDTYTIIYLKLQLIAMKNDGIIEFTHLENDFAEEIALDLDEEPDNVRATLIYLLNCGLAETNETGERYFFPYSISNTGSEGSSAKRMRDYRAKGLDASHCDGEKEIEKDIDIEIDKDIEKDNKERTGKRSTHSNFIKPTVEQIEAYEIEKGYPVEAETIFDYYESCGWTVGKNKPMKSWMAAVRGWHNKPWAAKAVSNVTTIIDQKEAGWVDE